MIKIISNSNGARLLNLIFNKVPLIRGILILLAADYTFFKVWQNGQWNSKRLKRWNGTAWEPALLKMWYNNAWHDM